MSNGTVNDLGELHGLLARTLAENIKSGEAIGTLPGIILIGFPDFIFRTIKFRRTHH